MPHPIKELTGLSARSYPKSILERPKLATLLGAISATWGQMDEAIKGIFNSATLGNRGLNGGEGISELANIIYSSVEKLGSRTRHGLVQDVINARFSTEVAKAFEDISQKYERMSAERNELVHSHFQISDKYPDDLLLITGPKWIRFTEADLLDRLNRHVELYKTINDYYILIMRSPRKEMD